MNIGDVLVTGHFNVLHPGHIRLYQFARQCGKRLVVGVESDRLAGKSAYIQEKLRLEGVLNCSLVDSAFIYDESIDVLIDRLRPQFVVKGREHEKLFNLEKDAVDIYGGQLIFSSGEMQFSSNDLIRQELFHLTSPSIELPSAFMSRHNISKKKIRDLLFGFLNVRVLTIGDLIIDDYVTCEALGMSQEDPTIVVSPIERRRFVGGAGIVAAHAAGLGAKSSLISVSGRDDASVFSNIELPKINVDLTLLEDTSRPTTLKERYRSHGKTLLRVSHLHQTPVSLDLQSKIVDNFKAQIRNIDLLLLSDFNYGVLPQAVVEEVVFIAKKNNILIAADSQSSSQMGDVGRFKDVDLLMPTEREARVSTQNKECGLVVLAEQLRQKSNSQTIFLKMGADGVLIHAKELSSADFRTDRVEALNKFPRDVAGAGDSMLVASALTLASRGSIWEAACIGSMAAAIQVSRVGNLPLTIRDFEVFFD